MSEVVTEAVVDPKATETKTEPDPKASLNEALKKAGVKLKARDKEYVPKDIDDLTSKAQRVFGLESELETLKAEKAEIAKQRESWKKLEADDDAALDEFDRLPENLQRTALKALHRRAAQQEAASKEPPEAAAYKRALAEREAKLREYETKEKERTEAETRRQSAAELQQAHQAVLKVAGEAFKVLKVDVEKHPAALRALQPSVARHMRAALEAEALTGTSVDTSEIVANVAREAVESFAAMASGMGDDGLYDSLGEGLVKRVLGEHLRRVKGIVKAPQTSAQTQSNGTTGPKKGTPGFLR